MTKLILLEYPIGVQKVPFEKHPESISIWVPTFSTLFLQFVLKPKSKEPKSIYKATKGVLTFPKRCCLWPSSKLVLSDKHAPFYQRAFFKEYKILVQGTIWSQSGVFGEMMGAQVSLNALGSVAQLSAPTA